MLNETFSVIFKHCADDAKFLSSKTLNFALLIFRGRPDIMTLESQSHNFGYSRKDIDGQFPENGKCIKGCPDTLSTNLDLPSLKSALEK